MITRAGLADEIDALDLQIKALNEAKSEAYKAYKQQLEDAGMEPRRASAEVAATKAAIGKRRKLRENPDAAREKDDMIDAILVEIMERPSRAREASQSYAEAKGRARELTDTQEQPEEPAHEVPAQDGGGNEAGESPLGKSNAARPASVDAHVNDGGLAGEVSNEVVTAGETAPHSSSVTPPPPGGTDKAGDVPPSPSPAALSEADVPAFLRKTIADYRPNCLHPDACAATGLQHCWSCRKAMEAAETEAA